MHTHSAAYSMMCLSRRMVHCVEMAWPLAHHKARNTALLHKTGLYQANCARQNITEQ